MRKGEKMCLQLKQIVHFETIATSVHYCGNVFNKPLLCDGRLWILLSWEVPTSPFHGDGWLGVETSCFQCWTR
jgi:hypothetical protein